MTDLAHPITFFFTCWNLLVFCLFSISVAPSLTNSRVNLGLDRWKKFDVFELIAAEPTIPTKPAIADEATLTIMGASDHALKAFLAASAKAGWAVAILSNIQFS